VHLVGFIIRIYHDAQSPERQRMSNLAITHSFLFYVCTYKILCLYRINLWHVLPKKEQITFRTQWKLKNKNIFNYLCLYFVTFQSNPHDDYTKLRANQKNKRVRSESSDYSASTDCKSELGPIPRTKSRGEHISLHSKWNGIGCHPVKLSNSLSLALVVPTLEFTAIWLWIWTENEWISVGSAWHTRYVVCNGSEKVNKLWESIIHDKNTKLDWIQIFHDKWISCILRTSRSSFSRHCYSSI